MGGSRSSVGPGGSSFSAIKFGQGIGTAGDRRATRPGAKRAGRIKQA
jgi:hypothetical protein